MNRLGFMYEWGSRLKMEEKEKEDYLLGKAIDEDGEVITD